MNQVIEKESIVTIRISKGKYNFLLATVKAFHDNIYKWGFDKFFEKRLLEDLKTMKETIEGGKYEHQ